MADNIEFECRTNGGFSPAGLPKVFVSFDPHDRRYVEPVLKDLFHVADCAVYCMKNEPAETETDFVDLEIQLAEMQVIVFLITSRYLTSNSFSRMHVYRIAMAKHIPIIPICMESGIEALFSTQMNIVGNGYGNVQLLMDHSNDLTEIPYIEKLSRSLHSIIPESEDLSKIHDIFSARVFLSYRKKDRKYAVELMKAIHNIPRFCNVSIWYDEFLKVGEEWSDEIRHMISQSDCVILLITPSVFEPGNYVISEEYPAAVSLNKEVIPITKTEKKLSMSAEEINSCFPGLGPFVSGNDARAIDAALAHLVPEANQSVETAYYTGLAFLHGIHVEKDPEKGFSLIFSAARMGMQQAMKKLSDMYRTGDGVSIDYRESIHWLEKILEIDRNSYRTNPSEAQGIRLFNTIAELIDNLFYVSDYRRASAHAKDLIKLSHSFIAEHNTLGAYDSLAKACSISGKIQLRLDGYNAALEYFQKYCEIMEKLYHVTNSTVVYHDLSVGYERMGMVYFKLRKFKEAEDWYEKTRKIREELNLSMNSLDSNSSLAHIMSELGDLQLRQGRFGNARDSYLRALEIWERVLQVDASFSNKRLYASALTLLGTIELMEQHIDKAEDCFSKGLKIYRQVADEDQTAEALRDLSICLNRLGHLEFSRRNYGPSARYYEESLRIRKDLAQNAESDHSVFDCAVTNYYLAEVYEEGIDIQKALQYYTETVNKLQPILFHDLTLDPHFIFAKASFKLFAYDTFHGKPYLRQAISTMKWLTEHAPDHSVYQKTHRQYLEIYQRCYPGPDSDNEY